MLSSNVGLHVFCRFEQEVRLSDNAIAVYFRYPAPGMRIPINSMWVRIQLLPFSADPDPAFQFNANADPDPAFHFNADPDPQGLHFEPPGLHCER